MLKSKIIMNRYGPANTGGTGDVENEMNKILGSLARERLIRIHMNDNRDVLVVWEEDTPVSV